MISIRKERPPDHGAREALLDASFGGNRQARTCQRLRDGRTPAEGLAFAAGKLRRKVHLRNPSQAEVCSTSEPVAG